MTAYHFRTRENGSCFEETEVNVTKASVGGSGGAKLAIAVGVSENQRGEVLETDYARQLTGGGGKPGQGYSAARTAHGVRRLTPRECERLQGFPDDWTLIPGASDSKRYAALGDAVTVPVAEWIGRRLMEVAASANRMAPYLDDGDVTLYHGDAITVLRSLPAGIAQTCVTSPPYWGLRDYGTGTWTGGYADFSGYDENGAWVEAAKDTHGNIVPRCDHSERKARNDSERLDAGLGGGHGGGTTVNTSISYRDVCGNCGAQRTDSQLGLEATPDLYVERMVAVFREVRRVLRDDGTLWLNLGDSYASTQASDNRDAEARSARSTLGPKRDGLGGTNAAHVARSFEPRRLDPGLKPKDLVGIPWRVAFALQADGWYLRSDIIWSKPNPMPESVTDRPTKSHEYLFLLTKQPKYYWDADAIREPHHPDGRGVTTRTVANGSHDNYQEFGHEEGRERWPGAGRNRRSVWTIPTERFPETHFATYPQELVRPCILAGTSERGECVECGTPWRRVVERELMEAKNARGSAPNTHRTYNKTPQRGMFRGGGAETTGWEPSCACDAPTRPQLVLDPFVGSGTTALVARKHGRRCIGIDLSAEYLALAAKRTQQLSLLGGVA